MNQPEQSLTERLRIRAQIRRQISTRKSVQEGKPDRLADLLDEAATELDKLKAGDPDAVIKVLDEVLSELKSINRHLTKLGK